MALEISQTMMYSLLEQLTYRLGWLKRISHLAPAVLAHPEINFRANSFESIKMDLNHQNSKY